MLMFKGGEPGVAYGSIDNVFEDKKSTPTSAVVSVTTVTFEPIRN